MNETGYPSAEDPPSTEMVREAYAYIPTAVEGITERREAAFDAWLESVTHARWRAAAEVVLANIRVGDLPALEAIAIASRTSSDSGEAS